MNINRRSFFGRVFAAIVGASFLSLDDSDGLYPFQREGLKYLRNGMKFATQSNDFDRAWTKNPDFPKLTPDEIDQILPYIELHGNTLVYWKVDPSHPASYNRSHRCMECAGYDR